MIRALLCLALAASSPAAGLQDEDVYYAPIEEGGAAPAAPPRPQGSFLSRARLQAFDIATGRPVEGAEIFVEGVFLGVSPLQLQGWLAPRPSLAVAARAPGYAEGLRPALRFPAEGSVAVALASERAAGWYTTPAWAVGLGLLAASALAYDTKAPAPGLALAGGGLAVISLSQLTARLVHLPRLRKRAEAYNSRDEAVPPLDTR